MKGTFIQVDCIEGKKLDPKQAKAVIKYKPDIILLEYSDEGKTPDTIFNKYTTENKPWRLLEEQIKRLKKHAVITPWIKSDILMWRNVSKLWRSGHEVKVYRIDAPRDLVGEWNEVWRNMYPSARKNWLWWVRIYLREKYMAKNIEWIFSKYKLKDDSTILVFLQSFHWEHVQFLLTNPLRDEIWKYYFGNFPEVSQTTIAEKIKSNNKVFYKYWKRVSDFT